MKARYGELANKVRALCARDIGCSLKDAAESLDRPLNVASTYVINLVKHGEAVKAGVHGEYRYFINREKADQHDKVAKEARRLQMIETKKRKDERRAAAEREKRAKIRAEKGPKPIKPPKQKKVSLKPRDSGIVVSTKEQDLEGKKQHIKATITWPDNVKVIKRETPVDYRFHFEPPPGWKGEFTREWEQRTAA